MNLLVSSLWGGLYLIILFGICFALVTAIKYVRLRSAQKKREQKSVNELPEKPPEKKETQQPRQVYYIVEKKRAKRPQAKYSEPKKIHFE